MIKGIFFDNDGVLVDTEIHYYNATKETLAEIGIDLSLDQFIELFMVKNIGTLHLIKEAGYERAVYEDIIKKRDIIYHNYLDSGNAILPGVYEVVEKLSREYALSIVTSSLRKHYEIIHKQTGLMGFFKTIIVNEDVKNTKPDPEPYLKALALSGFEKNEVVIIEDSQRGLISAHKAGIRSIVIPGHLNHQGDFSLATHRLNTISELPNFLKEL